MANYFGNNDLTARLLRNRIIFLTSAVDTDMANRVCAQLLLLEADDPEKDISIYINSPGGSVYDGLAIYDTMQYVANDIRTICFGMAASMGQMLLCAGTKGKRYSLPNSRILMHQPHTGGGVFQGQATDVAIWAEDFTKSRLRLAELIAKHTGQDLERVLSDSDRDKWYSAEEALDYGFIDAVIEKSALAQGK